MNNQSSAIDFFKKQAKVLLKDFTSNDSPAIERVQKIIVDKDNFSLMKAQHVIAIENGFSKWQDMVQASDVKLRLAITMAKIPELTFFGIGVYDQRKLSPNDHRLQYEKKRDELRKNADNVERILVWLKQNVKPIKTINSNQSSYTLKHVAEGQLGEYVGNGAFIAAAIIAGYPYKIHSDSPNVHFGMSMKSLKEVSRMPRVPRLQTLNSDKETSFKDFLDTLKRLSADAIQSTCEKSALKDDIQESLLKYFLESKDDVQELPMREYFVAKAVSVKNLTYELDGDELYVHGDYDIEFKFEFDDVPEEMKDLPHFSREPMFGDFEVKIDKNKKMTFENPSIGENFEGKLYMGSFKMGHI